MLINDTAASDWVVLPSCKMQNQQINDADICRTGKSTLLKDHIIYERYVSVQ